MTLTKGAGLAAIQYIGRAGISASCLDAVMRLVQFDERIGLAQILTADNCHCLLLTLDGGELVAVKSGFSSGYGGEGPRTLAKVLCILRAYRVEIDECAVPAALLDRIDASALTVKDLDLIQSSDAVRPMRWYDYIYDVGYRGVENGDVWKLFRPIMPWAIIDSRISDLAVEFFDDPDRSILNAFRRLEDIIRKRLNTDASSTRLFSMAFNGDDSQLIWPDIDSGEQKGRGQIFTGAYLAYRNPRAHKEVSQNRGAALTEFLLLNQLYLLENTAIPRPSATTP
ncbi:TIGR02391 family protein [Cupriavidus sp. 8B]